MTLEENMNDKSNPVGKCPLMHGDNIRAGGRDTKKIDWWYASD